MRAFDPEAFVKTYVERIAEARAIRLELECLRLLDSGVALDDMEIVHPKGARPFVRNIGVA